MDEKFRDINKYPYLSAVGIDFNKGKFYEMKGVPMKLLRLSENYIIGLDVWDSQQKFQNFAAPLSAWRWSKKLTNEEKHQHIEIITEIENAALSWLKCSSETHKLISLSINLEDLSVSASASEIESPDFIIKRDADSSKFEQIKEEHSGLVFGFGNFIWTCAKENDPRFTYFN